MKMKEQRKFEMLNVEQELAAGARLATESFR